MFGSIIVLGIAVLIGSAVIWFTLPESTIGRKIGVVATYIATTVGGLWAYFGLGD